MIITKVPYRLSIAGGGCDLPAFYEKHGASLITASISKYMYVFVSRPAASDKIQLYHHAKETVSVNEIDKIEHNIIRETLKFLKIDFPLEIGSMCDVPVASGLGSSSVFTVGLLAGLHALKREYVSPEQLAEEACHVEIDLVGKPIGKQDQYAAAIGGINELVIDKSGKVTVNRMNLDTEFIRDLENRLMMFYLGSTRDANVILAEQSEKIKKSDAIAEDAMLFIAGVGQDIKKALINKNITEFGLSLNNHWNAKKLISDKMSNHDIEWYYELAMSNGAIGFKNIGAGGGGFILVCCEEGMRRMLKNAMEVAGLKFMDFRFEFEGAKVLTNI